MISNNEIQKQSEQKIKKPSKQSTQIKQKQMHGIKSQFNKQQAQSIRDQANYKTNYRMQDNIAQEIKSSKNIENQKLQISVQSPLKKNKIKHKELIKDSTTPNRNFTNQKTNSQDINSKSKILVQGFPIQKQSKTKLAAKNPNIVDQTLYIENFCIVGVKQNYLMLLSDSDQLLEFPVGMLSGLKGNNQSGNNAEINQKVKIGQPIRLRLDYDDQKMDKQQKNFKNLQRQIYEQFNSDSEQSD